MTIESLYWLQVSAPYFKLFIIWTSYKHSRTFNIWNFSNNILMSILNSLYFVPCLPVPKVKCLILRTTNNIIAGLTIIDWNCIFMLCILTNIFLSRQIPNNSFSIPWASNNMVGIDKINGWNGTIMYYFKWRIATTIKCKDFTISTS